MAIPDVLLVRRVLAGNRAAFGTLYDRYGPRVYNLLSRLTNNKTVAEDLAQETFLIAFRSLRAWRGTGPFGAWICGIAVRCYRNNCRRQHSEDPLDDSLPAPMDGNPLARATRAEAHAAMETAIAGLPDLCREAFVLVYVEELAYKEVATLLGIPVGTVQSRLNRAKRMLQARLPHLLDDPGTQPGVAPLPAHAQQSGIAPSPSRAASSIVKGAKSHAG